MARIPTKKYKMDEKLSWEERYKQLEKHHEEETALLIEKIELLELQVEELQEELQELNYQLYAQ